MIQVTYQKRNGDIIQRYRNTLVSHKIGDETSMGWKVVDIKYKYKNNYYPSYVYDYLIEKDWKRKMFLLKIKRKLQSLYNDLVPLFCFLILFKYIKDMFSNFI